jgi:hypothetical protein
MSWTISDWQIFDFSIAGWKIGAMRHGKGF